MISFLVLLGLSSSFAYHISQDELFNCRAHNPQTWIDTTAMLGTWYVVEIIHHLPHKKMDRPWDHRVSMYACPMLYLTQQDHTHFRIVWSEEDYTVYYAIKRLDPRAPGVWTASGPNHETLVEHSDYRLKETGTVEVMKAVKDHAVLTFCKVEHNNSQLFSAIISRQPHILYAERLGIEKMLRRRNLTEYIVKQTCNAASEVLSTITFVLATSLALIFS